MSPSHFPKSVFLFRGLQEIFDDVVLPVKLFQQESHGDPGIMRVMEEQHFPHAQKQSGYLLEWRNRGNKLAERRVAAEIGKRDVLYDMNNVRDSPPLQKVVDYFRANGQHDFLHIDVSGLNL
jgi:hypothetical protein